MDGAPSNRLAEFAAILFRAGRVVPLEKLVVHFGCKAHELAVVAEEVNRQLEPLGLQAGFVAGGYRLTTRPEVYHALREFFTELRESGISPQAMEVLAIVAYRQPVTRANVEEVRQVNSESPLRSLLQRRLIKVKGRSDLPGRPFLYMTTGRFLEVFGLSTLDDLPKMDLDELAPGERVGI